MRCSRTNERCCAARATRTSLSARPREPATRAGHAPGELSFGGSRVRVRRPRVPSVDGEEIALNTWEQFAVMDPLTPRAVEQMVLGVSTRKYVRSIEGAPPGPLRVARARVP